MIFGDCAENHPPSCDSCLGSGSAATRCAGPTTNTEHLGDLSGHLAWSGRDVRPAIAEGKDPGAGEMVIPVDVLPAGFGRVRAESIEFDAQRELVEEVVQISRPQACLCRTWRRGLGKRGGRSTFRR